MDGGDSGQERYRKSAGACPPEPDGNHRREAVPARNDEVRPADRGWRAGRQKRAQHPGRLRRRRRREPGHHALHRADARADAACRIPVAGRSGSLHRHGIRRSQGGRSRCPPALERQRAAGRLQFHAEAAPLPAASQAGRAEYLDVPRLQQGHGIAAGHDPCPLRRAVHGLQPQRAAGEPQGLRQPHGHDASPQRP